MAHVVDIYLDELPEVEYSVARRMIDPFLQTLITTKLTHLIKFIGDRLLLRFALAFPEFKTEAFELASSPAIKIEAARDKLY